MGPFGTVFEISANGALMTLYAFGTITNASGGLLDGAYPFAALVQGSDETKRSKSVKTQTSLAGAAGWPNDPRARQRKTEREEVVSSSRRQRAGCFRLVFASGVFGCRLLFPSAQAAELTSGHYR